MADDPRPGPNPRSEPYGIWSSAERRPVGGSGERAHKRMGPLLGQLGLEQRDQKGWPGSSATRVSPSSS
ncbi:hypothetical protein [Microbispora bryophytorum]|uniref:hypothetical protein n=1 Tax=Microbispora bryophytorum TaxID=1460882 RepID=UPI0033FB5CF9